MRGRELLFCLSDWPTKQPVKHEILRNTRTNIIAEHFDGTDLRTLNMWEDSKLDLLSLDCHNFCEGNIRISSLIVQLLRQESILAGDSNGYELCSICRLMLLLLTSWIFQCWNFLNWWSWASFSLDIISRTTCIRWILLKFLIFSWKFFKTSEGVQYNHWMSHRYVMWISIFQLWNALINHHVNWWIICVQVFVPVWRPLVLTLHIFY